MFKESRWQSAGEFPTQPPDGYASLTRDGGHTPTDAGLAVVRRFTAPFAGEVRLRGQMGHRGDNGDGVRTSIWIGGRRVFSGTQKRNNRPYGPSSGTVKAGGTIDFVAAPGQSDSFDTFFWRASVRLVGDDGRTIETDSAKHFSGPLSPEAGRDQPLDRLAQLAHTLMMSNEFAFVD